MLTACGIETYLLSQKYGKANNNSVATVLTACGIETRSSRFLIGISTVVATVLTACGIETHLLPQPLSLRRLLQQCLPLAVLKPSAETSSALISLSCNSAYRLRY